MPDLTGKLVVEIPCRTCGGFGWHQRPGSFGSMTCRTCYGATVEHITPEAYCALRGTHGPWVITVTEGFGWESESIDWPDEEIITEHVHCGICGANPPAKEQ